MDKREFIDMLKAKAGTKSDEAFGDIFGVSKQTVGYWKSGKQGIDFDRLLRKFGPETLKFIQEEYNIPASLPEESDAEDSFMAEARKIQAMFDRGLIKIDRGEKDAGSASGQVKEGHQELAITIPVFAHAIAAGKPVTCSGTIEEYITISANRVKHPKDTYAVKAFGDSMKDAGILEGDLLIVDRAIEPMNNHIVIASINDEQTVKRLKIKKGAVSLLPENSSYKPIAITAEMDFRTLGVVTYVIRKTV
ncbi:MAG: translesion error-prone DNA polymerase V autoproteolytic subunit [Chlorobiaceae bacterium]|nr:translesion error-prone DNA polymerase V autoproteolytic subunit [Chlorobiaceae bacterium]